MRLFWINCLLLASVAAALPNARHKRDLSTIKNWIRKAIFGRQQINIHQSPILKTENGYQLYRLPGFDNEMIRVVPRTSLVKEFVYPDLKSVNVNAFGSVVGTQSNKDTLEAVRKVNNLLRTGILNGNHNNVMKESISPMFPTLNTANYVAAENIKTDPVIEKRPPVLKEVIKPTNNYEEQIEVKVPFEPKYSYTQTKNNVPVMTYTARNNPNVKVVETFTKTELPKCVKERIDEVIVLGANPNSLALGQEPFQFQSSPVVDISYSNVETNTFIQNPSNGRIFSEHLGTVGNSRSSPTLFKDSHIRHNGRPLKTEAINPHPVPLYSDSSDLDDFKMTPSKTSDNSFPSKTYAFSNSGNKVDLSRTLGPTPPQYLTSDVSLPKRTNANQTRVATFGATKDNISNGMIPENVGDNYEEKIELKVPFEPNYSYTQLKNNEPVMTYTAHNNPNVKVVETFTKTELPKRLKERFDENIVLGANPNRLPHAQEVYQFQSSPVVDISYPNVETNTFIQNPSNGRIFSEHLGTVGNSRSSPTLFKDSHIRHNGRPLKTEAINPHPVPLYSDSSDLDDFKITPSKTSDNSFPSKTYAFSNSGNKVDLSRTLGPTPPQYLTSDVSLSKRTNANQTRVATFGTTKDNISNGMIPENVGDNYEEKIELKVPFEPKYSYTQTKNNVPVMTYTAHNNPNVKVMETFTTTELPKRLKERVDEVIVLGDNPNRLAHAQEVYQFQSSPVVDISYPNVETNTFIQNPSNGRILSEHLGTAVNSRSSPTLFKDSHIRHNGRPMKIQAINRRPVPLHSDSLELDDFKMTPSKISDNSFPSKTYAFSNSGNKVDLSRTLGPTPPQYLTSDVSLPKRTNANQTNVATIMATKDNISNGMIPDNVYKYQTNPNTGKMVKEDDALTADVNTDTNYYFVPSEINRNPATLQITKKKDGAYDNPQTPTAVSSSTNAPKEDLLNENEYIFFKGNPTVEPDIKTYSYKKKNADGSSLSIVGNKNGVMVDVKESKQINRGDIPEEQRK